MINFTCISHEQDQNKTRKLSDMSAGSLHHFKIDNNGDGATCVSLPVTTSQSVTIPVCCGAWVSPCFHATYVYRYFLIYIV